MWEPAENVVHATDEVADFHQDYPLRPSPKDQPHQEPRDVGTSSSASQRASDMSDTPENGNIGVSQARVERAKREAEQAKHGWNK